MPFIKNQISRQLLKRTATTGLTPTIGPTLDHTDGLWTATDIYGGEFYWNMADQALWLGWATGTTSGVTLIYSGGTGGGGGVYTADNGLTENPTNNFQWGGYLGQDTIIDGAGSFGITFQALKEFYLYSDKNVYLYAANGGQEGILNIDPLTNQYLELSYDDGTDFTAIQMSGAKMVIKTPDFASKNNGDVLTLIDNISGEVEYTPAPGLDPSTCITDLYVTNIHGCSPINILDDVIASSGLTATTISATTYQNLPVSAITAGSNIVISNTDGNVTISQNNAGSNVIWKDNTTYSSNVAANTLVTSKLIPANTFELNDFLEINSNFSGNTPNGTTYFVRVYINTTSSLVGATLLGTFGNGVGTGSYAGFYRHGFITATGTTGNLSIVQTNQSLTSSIAFSNIQTTQVTINTTIDQYLIFAIQSGNVLYTIQLRGINARIQR